MVEIPGFRISERLGEGAAADVYDAVDLEQGRRVAVKVLKAEHEERPHVVRRFRAEARIAAKLAHDGIVAMHRCSTRRPPYWIAYEHLGGGTLRDRLARGRLPASEAVRVFLRVCDALDHAHRQQVIHRDIKPSNILFGEDGRPRLIDFGISKDLDRTDHTQMGSQLGTVAYMPPELTWSGRMNRSEARTADVWSLGVVLFEMLAGRLPFPGPESVLVPQIRHSAPLPLGQFVHAPQELERVLGRALDKDPRRRYRTVAAFAGAVRGALAASETHAEQPRRQRRPRATGTRRWLLVALLTVLAALLVVVGMLVAASSAEPTLAFPAPPARSASAAAGGELSTESASGQFSGGDYDSDAEWQLDPQAVRGQAAGAQSRTGQAAAWEGSGAGDEEADLPAGEALW